MIQKLEFRFKKFLYQYLVKTTIRFMCNMGNIYSSVNTVSTYIARETFHPSDIAFNNFPLSRNGKNPAKDAHLLRIENSLRITIDDKLEMVEPSVILVGSDGTTLYKMKNITTGEVGLVIRDFVDIPDDTELNEILDQSSLDKEV